jgi:NAD(P)-dependent dehydrogenase (short-subunit alcohol dehydrogenase family)
MSGRVALIAGGNRGLGEAMVHALAAAGANVALVARDAARLEKVRADLLAQGGKAEGFTADVTDEADVARVAAAVQEKLGAVQILVTNAGINIRKKITDFTLAGFRSARG